MYFSSTYLTYPIPENTDVKYSELLAQEDIEELHFKYDYTALQVYLPLKAFLEQNSRWVYDGNGRWSTSDRMVRLRSNGDRFHLEVWIISGHVQRIHQLGIDDTQDLLKQLRRVGV